MNLKKIQAFILVIEKESFSLAAEIAGVSQPSISQSIRSLEEDLGVTLLKRTHSIIQPTPAGTYIFDMGKAILDQWYIMEEGVKAFQGTITGTIKIGASTIPGTYLLPRWIGNFKKLFPKVNATIEIRDSDEITTLLLNRKIDFGIVGSPPESSSIYSKVVAKDSLALIVPIGHPLLSTKNTITLDDITSFDFILRDPGSGTRKTMENILDTYGILTNELQCVAQFGSTEAVISAVEEGLGISFVSKLAATRALMGERIQIVTLTEFFQQTFSFACLKGNEDYPLVKNFLSTIESNRI